MIKYDTQDDTQGEAGVYVEDTRWVVAGVIVSIVMLVIVYFGLTQYSIF